MRKAMKRQLGRERQAKHLAESIESGLKAQEIDTKRREKETQQALIQRQARVPKRPENEGSSKLAQEKKARIQARREEMEALNADVDTDDLKSELDVARDFVKMALIGNVVKL